MEGRWAVGESPFPLRSGIYQGGILGYHDPVGLLGTDQFPPLPLRPVQYCEGVRSQGPKKMCCSPLVLGRSLLTLYCSKALGLDNDAVYFSAGKKKM